MIFKICTLLKGVVRDKFDSVLVTTLEFVLSLLKVPLDSFLPKNMLPCDLNFLPEPKLGQKSDKGIL